MTEQEERDRIAKDICKIRDITTKWKIYLDIADYVIHERQEAKKEGAEEAWAKANDMLKNYFKKREDKRLKKKCILLKPEWAKKIIAENQPEVLDV